MKLGKKKLQDLKNGSIRIEDLNFRYFVNAENELEIENMLSLLNNGNCSVAAIFECFRNFLAEDEIEEESLDAVLERLLLVNDELFDKFLITSSEKEKLWDVLNAEQKALYLTRKFSKPLSKDFKSFEKIFEIFKDARALQDLLRNEEIFKFFIDKHAISKETLNFIQNAVCIWSGFSGSAFRAFLENTTLICYMFEQCRLEKEAFQKLLDTCKTSELQNLLKTDIDVKKLIEFKNGQNSFKNLVDKAELFSELETLFDQHDLFKALVESNFIDVNDIRYLVEKRNAEDRSQTRALAKNQIIVQCIIEQKLYQTLKNSDYFARCLTSVLSLNSELFKTLDDKKLLTKDLLTLLIDNLDSDAACNLLKNQKLLIYLLKAGSFEKLIQTYKKCNELDRFFGSANLPLCDLFSKQLIDKEDLKYLLNIVDNIHELGKFCRNTSLLKHILNEFILDKETVTRFNTIIENISWCKSRNIHTTFDLIEYEIKNDEEILKLNELNRKVYTLDLTKDQKLELIEVLRDNEIAQNRLKDIIDSNLENNYDFESLTRYLKKTEKRNLINI